MRTFRKYQFGSKGAATTKINQLSVDEEGNEVEHNHAIVRLGYIPIVEDINTTALEDQNALRVSIKFSVRNIPEPIEVDVLLERVR